MSEASSELQVDPYLEAMKLARKGPAVLKTRLALVKSQVGGKYIFAFEGDNDKAVYAHWFRKCDPNFSYVQYEPFPCGGKYFVLQLKQVIDRDLNNMGEGVYFFVDRDFDDLQGLSPSDDVFMTGCYSIENYLVNEQVLDAILVNEVQCHGEPVLRSQIVAIFSSAYSEFLATTKAHNNRLFLARQLQINAEISGNINRLATVELSSVSSCETPVTVAIQIGREATAEEIEKIQPIFDGLEARERYRGKFALLFFMRWLQEVCADRNSAESKFFSEIKNGCEIKAKVPSFESLAAHSAPPNGLCEFLERVKNAAHN